MSAVALSVNDGIATIKMDIPEKMNALSWDLVTQFIEHLETVQYDNDVRCVVITGTEEAFCAGADVTDRRSADDTVDLPASVEANFHEIIRLIMRMKKPVIAKVRGPAVGAGACIATACDFVYADASAKFGWVFVNLGIAVDSGVSFILPRLVGMRKAIELVYRGTIIDAEEAKQLGITTDTVASEDLDAVVGDLATELGEGPTRALGEIKRLFLRGTHSTVEEMLDAEATAQGVIFHSDDRAEGMKAFAQSREPDFRGK